MPSPCISRISIIGLGLIGASMLQALKRSPLAGEQQIVFKGFDPGFSSQDILRIKELGLDSFETDKTSLYDTDLIILAAPVHTNISLLEEIARLAPQSVLVSDVSSTKEAIAQRASSLGIDFVGMHPIAGREQQGYQASHETLLEDKTLVLCATAEMMERQRVKNLIELLISARCKVLAMTPHEHDRAVASISHLPQLLSTALINHCRDDIEKAGPGFTTLTRLAGSPWHIWQDIIETNSANIATELRAFCDEIAVLADDVQHNRTEKLKLRFDSANDLYTVLNRRKPQ